ncbi:hypothetical protein GNX71_20965 [Variovorax sp. RKNM96]|uniref:hypothetical protein n=1 Tax=Variovorax sp. RKNM96 TaxID=2681552 RepID=UPI00197EF5E3|nr:hypothetical protein [Variovorax sp. RKNM96]QSI31917.1 hypothetical protein GNX71_20965 [Variovorax sp. RKNM96]
MEIYSSAAQQEKTRQDRPVFYSRTRLIAGTALWAVVTVVLAVLCVRAQDKNIGILIAACFGLLTAWLTFKCLNTLRNIDQPAFVVGHQGLTFENGMLLPWDNIVENTWVNQNYMGIPIGRQIQIKTDLPKPRARVLRRATGLEISGDEYLALCDAYR